MIVNEPAYGDERAYNALRIATALLNNPEVSMKVFLIGDGVVCAKKDHKVPSGFYDLNAMLSSLIQKGVEVGLCGMCMDARGLKDEELIEGAHRSSMKELSGWVLQADKVINC